MTRSRLAAMALLLTLAALPARAEDDAETRFHRAYEQEVVDGKVADAARTYLALMNDETAPERIRLEARFRFAVTTVILGRADEGRAQLAELSRDPKASESLRARAAEYLEATRAIGVGSELDRKLQSLVFELAKAPAGLGADHPQGSPYREFEVIGARAVPFLRQLAKHQDLALRAHALRILARMKEPGVAELWTPEVSAGNPALQWDLYRYLRALPAEAAAFEQRLLALDAEKLAAALGQTQLRAPLTADGLRALAARKLPADAVMAWFPWDDANADALRAEWISAGPPELSAKAADSYLRNLQSRGGAVTPDASLFVPIVDRLSTQPLGWKPSQWYSQGVGADDRAKPAQGLIALAGVVALESWMDTLVRVVERASAGADGPANPLRSGLVEALLLGAEFRPDQAELPTRLVPTLRRFAEACVEHKIPLWEWFPPRTAGAIARLPRAAATELAQWAATAQLPDVNAELRARAIPVRRPTDVPVAMAAARVADADTRRAIYAGMGLPSQSVNFDTSPEYARALAPYLGQVAAAGEEGMRLVGFPLHDLVWYLQALPAGEARERLLEVGRAVLAYRERGQRLQALRSIATGTFPASTLPPRWDELFLPALDTFWASLTAAERIDLLSIVTAWLGSTPKDASARATIAAFLRGRLGEMDESSAVALAHASDVLPYEEWLPKVPEGAVPRVKSITADEADAVVRKLSSDPATTSPNVLAFARWQASPEVQKELFDRMLREAPIASLDAVLRYATRGFQSLSGAPFSDAALDAAISRVLATETLPEGLLARMARVSAKRQPNERTLAAAKRLLESRDREDLFAGIEVAASLGREELLPALGGLLDSMDADLRGRAKEAIDAIVALRRLKEETRRQAEGK